MKIRIVLSIIYCLSFQYSFSYSDSTIVSKDFKSLVGCWKGSLTYLDYSSNKPFTMPADIVVKDFKNSNFIICSISYPKEPNANSLDTLFISKNGRQLNNEDIKSKGKFNSDSLEIVTESSSIDGNDHKPATIRHTYTLGKNTYTVKKEVKFSGQTSWILRNEYKFVRTKPCS